MINGKSEKCTGCAACSNSCPSGAIRMAADEEGFLRPVIDEQICVDCGRCNAVCPLEHPEPEKTQEMKAYALNSRDESARAASSSGGAFSLLAQEVIRSGGVVFGAAFNDKLKVVHTWADSEEDLLKLRGAKYVQSDIGTSYADAKRFLDAGRLVLFSGTPCQISGFLGYLGKSYDNLYTQDIICHGIPSPIAFRSYVEWLEKQFGSKAMDISFRSKETGWQRYSVRIEFQNGSVYLKEHNDDPYIKAFLKNLSLRPSCYTCMFKSVNRQADITLADLWGINNVCPGLNDDNGTSLVFVNSDKGAALFKCIVPNAICEEVDGQQVIRYNSAMITAASRPENREYFLLDTKNKGFDFSVKKYLRDGFVESAKKFAKRIICK